MTIFVFFLFVTILDGSGKTCQVIEIGPNLFNGNFIIAWKKKFPYGPLLDY